MQGSDHLPPIEPLGSSGEHSYVSTLAADTFADSRHPTANFGQHEQLRFSGAAAPSRVAYLSFALPELPPGATDVKATMTLPPTVPSAFTVRSYLVSAFDESQVTWNDRPAVGEMLDEGRAQRLGVPIVLDVTAGLQDVTHSQNELDIALLANGPEHASTWISSRESGFAAAQLRVTWRGESLHLPAEPAAVEPADPEAGEPEPSESPGPEPTPEPTDPVQPGSGSLLLGATVTPHGDRQTIADEIAHLEDDQAMLQIRRVFDPGFDPDFMHRGALDVGRRATHYSLKPDMDALARGELDQKVERFLNSIPAGHRTILTVWHEPENNFTTSEEKAAYRDGWRRFAELVRGQNRAELSTSWVMMSYSWTVASGRDPMDWWPGADVIDIVGIDLYNEGSLKGSGWDSAGRWLGEPSDGETPIETLDDQSILEWIEERGLPFGIAEFGSLENESGLTATWTDTPTKAAWIQHAVEYFESIGAVYAEYFHHGPNRGDWWLDAASAEPLHAFRELLAQYVYRPPRWSQAE